MAPGRRALEAAAMPLREDESRTGLLTRWMLRRSAVALDQRRAGFERDTGQR
jgi:hypothetical protein